MEGSAYHVSETALQTFHPGDRSRFVHPSMWGGEVRRSEPSPVGTICEVEVPARLHASVVDMNRFGVGVPGGGGVGFAVALYSSARVVSTFDGEARVTGARAGIARHVMGLFRHITGYEGGFRVEVQDHGRRHMGLGSSIGTLTAVGVAVNEILGRPLSIRDLRKLIAHNYCEEAPNENGALVQGFETNVGAMLGVHGGLVVASDSCELVYRIPLPEEMRALLLIPHLGPQVCSGEPEASALLNGARLLDREDAPGKAYRILMDLVPAMIRGDLVGIGNVVFELARRGSKRAECSLHGSGGLEIYAAMEALRSAGAEIVGMSSVGPAVFALTRSSEVRERWAKWKTSERSGCALEVPVDSTGARVRIDGVPVPCGHEPWWVNPFAG